MSSQYHKTGEESPENQIFTKGDNSIKSRSNTTKFIIDLNYVTANSCMKLQVCMSKDDKEKSGKRNFSKRQYNVTHVKVGQTRQKSNLICIMSRQIHIPNFRSI